MTPPFQSTTDSQANREKHRVALSSLIAAVLLTGTKAGVGWWTNSLGILSEAAHSALDLVAAAITLWAVRIASRPADREHTYGHGKFENLSAMVQTLLLLLACVWIIYEAVGRLFFEGEVEVNPNIWAFLVVILSIVVDVSRSRALGRIARKYQSQALEADALHFSTDVWSSGVVLLGLFGVLLAERMNVPWLANADSVAALGVAVIVIGVSVKLGKKTVSDLLDAVPKDLQSRVATAAAVPGVEAVKQVRVRRSGPEIFADVTVTVDHTAGLERAHEIADRAEAAVQAILPKADIVLHVEPTASQGVDVLTTVRLLAARHGMAAHGIRIYEQDSQRWLELHLEVNETLKLEEAHQQATQFEQAVRDAVPGLTHVVTHIEPAGQAAATHQAQPASQLRVEEAVREFIDVHRPKVDPHDLKVQWVGGELTVSLHCTLDAATTITEAHDFTERLEQHLRRQIPSLGRVVIHVEPNEPAHEAPRATADE